MIANILKYKKLELTILFRSQDIIFISRSVLLALLENLYIKKVLKYFLPTNPEILGRGI